MDSVELMQAAFDGDVLALRALLNAGADPNWIDPNAGHTVLYNACRGDKVTAVRTLLEYGAEPNHRIDYLSPVDGRKESGVVALMYARSTDVAELLISAGAEVDAADERGATALHHAVYWGKGDVVKSLLKAGADPLRKTKDGKSVLDIVRSRIEHYRSLAIGPNNDAVAEQMAVFERIVDLLPGESAA